MMIICIVLAYELWKVPLQAVFLKDEGPCEIEAERCVNVERA